MYLILIKVLFFQLIFKEIITETPKQFKGYSVLRIKPTSADNLSLIKRLAEKDSYVDFWTYPSSVNSIFDIMIPPQNKSKFEKLLFDNKIAHETIINDLQELLLSQINYRTPSKASRDFFDDYQRLGAIFNFLDTIVQQHRDIASVENIGKSYENRDIRLIKIGVNHHTNNKPVIWIDAGVHAREWIGPATACFVIQTLVNNTDPSVRKLIEQFDWYILPVANPDGYEYTHTTNRMWRKTRSKIRGSSCIGVDPNRNFAFHWNENGASRDPCHETYSGSRAFSENETQALSNYILKINTNRRVKVYISFHSYSQLWLFPWGYTSQLPPDNSAMEAKAIIATKALKKSYGTTYTYGTSTNVLYPAAGGSDDWAYGSANVKYSYTVELRDKGRYGFALPKNQIKPSGIETFEGVKALAQSVAEEVFPK